jgi:hypothetical protein
MAFTTTEQKNNLQHIKQSKSYQSFDQMSKVLDNYCLDPIIGLVPVVGDLITSFMGMQAVTIALKIGSIPLLLSMLLNIALDFLIGVIPYAGMVLDFLFRGHRKNYSILTGYIDGDQAVINKVNSRAVITVIAIVVIVFVTYKVIMMIGGLFTWFFGLFG